MGNGWSQIFGRAWRGDAKGDTRFHKVGHIFYGLTFLSSFWWLVVAAGHRRIIKEDCAVFGLKRVQRWRDAANSEAFVKQTHFVLYISRLAFNKFFRERSRRFKHYKRRNNIKLASKFLILKKFWYVTSTKITIYYYFEQPSAGPRGGLSVVS